MIIRKIDTSRPAPRLPDGRPLAPMRYGEVWRAMEKLRIPGISPALGKDGLIDRYRDHIAAVAEDLRGPAKPGEMRVHGVPEELAARAIEIIGRNAANAA